MCPGLSNLNFLTSPCENTCHKFSFIPPETILQFTLHSALLEKQSEGQHSGTITNKTKMRACFILTYSSGLNNSPVIFSFFLQWQTESLVQTIKMCHGENTWKVVEDLLLIGPEVTCEGWARTTFDRAMKASKGLISLVNTSILLNLVWCSCNTSHVTF